MNQETEIRESRAEQSVGLCANWIKLIAYAAMLLDHFAYCFLQKESALYLVFRIVGRIAAPVMCFFIAEGYRHTSNLKKYMGRLALMAVISHVPYVLCFGYGISAAWKVWRVTSVIWSLLMGLVALTLFEKIRWEKYPILEWLARIAAVVVCALLAYSADWNYIAVIWILAFGLLYESKLRRTAAFLLGAVVYLGQCYRNGLLTRWFPLGVVLFLPLLFLYTGKLGKKSKVRQWAAYWFYPVHLIVLYLIALLLQLR